MATGDLHVTQKTVTNVHTSSTPSGEFPGNGRRRKREEEGSSFNPFGDDVNDTISPHLDFTHNPEDIDYLHPSSYLLRMCLNISVLSHPVSVGGYLSSKTFSVHFSPCLHPSNGLRLVLVLPFSKRLP